MVKKIQSALISVYHKKNLDSIIKKLDELNVMLYSTGGTKTFIEELGVKVTAVEDLTSYPSILGGRVKTLHPKIFGGILTRRDHEKDKKHTEQYEIPEIDLVIVDLYPFKETVKSGANEQEIIEKIDIGGISLIRAAAKNFRDVVIISSSAQYEQFLEMLKANQGNTNLEERKDFAREAFNISSDYDTAIFKYFNSENSDYFKESITSFKTLRYGENPHQKGLFYGDIEDVVEQINGKEISYNNLLDIDAAIHLIDEFEETTVAVIKHNNACGIASRNTLFDAWKDALAGDPVSAFGGIIVSNRFIDKQTAEEIHKLFYEVLIAPGFDNDALEILTQNKKRIILKRKEVKLPEYQYRSLLNGVLYQEKDILINKAVDFEKTTEFVPTDQEKIDLEFANKLVKSTKSNAIVLAKNKQLVASGVGQTSRVDALNQAINKAKSFGFDLSGAVMASDAFFPFPDCVEIANEAGITSVIQPGGSIRDKDSIEYCNNNNMSMVFTGTRHFKH